MGSFTFKWEHPAEDVYVTGTFDSWTKSVKLEKEGDVFLKTVDLKDASTKIYYKFVVNGIWVINESAPKEPDHEGNINNFLTPEDIKKETPSAAILNTITPTSTTATMAGEQPIETKPEETFKTLPVEEKVDTPAGILNSVTPQSTTAALAGEQPIETKPAETKAVETPLDEPKATPSDVPGGFPITPANELENTFGVNPLPAADGAVNPITLAPGEKVPENITSQSTNGHVKLDKESYEKSDALPGIETELPPVSKNTIPESSLPIADIKDTVISTIAPTSTTAALAGDVPLEPVVPEVVKESQEKAGVSPEASAEPKEVKEKAKVEEELKETIPVAPTTSEGTSDFGTLKSEDDKSTGLAALAATAGGAVIAGALLAKDTIQETAAPYVSDAADIANKNLPDSVKEKLPVAAQEALAAQGKEETIEEVSPEVPAEVKESIVESGKSPEAAANTEAVEDKKLVEAELLEGVKLAPLEGETKAGLVAPEVPAEVQESLVEAGKSPEAAANVEAVEDKKLVEAELLKEVKPVPAVDETKTEEVKPEVKPEVQPAVPAVTALSSESYAPKTEEVKPEETKPEVQPQPLVPAIVEPVVPETEAPKTEEVKPVEVAPKTEEVKTTTEEPKTEVPAAAVGNGTSATGNGTSATETKPSEAASSANGSTSANKKKHNRLSSIFSKIKHKFSDSK
ncbi:Fc.00g101790.m01.CDS01 [Cosmosporella sp. VM-42]